MELLYKLIQPISFFVIVYLLIVKENEKEGFSILNLGVGVFTPAHIVKDGIGSLIMANSARKGGLKKNGKYIIPKVSIPLTFKISNKYIIKHIKYYLLIYIYLFSFNWLSWESFYTSKAWIDTGKNLWMFFKGAGIFIYDIFVDLFTGSEPEKGFFGVIIRLLYLIFWWCYFIYFIFPFSILIFSGGFIVSLLASLYNITIGVVVFFWRELKLSDNFMSLIK